MLHSKTYEKLVERHFGRDLLADHHVNLEHIPLILGDGFLIPTELEKISRTTSRKGRLHANFYHVEPRPSMPLLTGPFIPFSNIIVKLPRKANWVQDERQELSTPDRHVGNRAFLQARIKTFKSIKPKRFVALRLSYAPEHTTPSVEHIRSDAVKDLLTSRLGKLRPRDFEQKTDQQLFQHLVKTIHRASGGTVAVTHQQTPRGVEVKIPWYPLAIAMAKLKGIPVYGWDGKLIK